MFALQRNQAALYCFLGHCSGTPLWVNEDFPVTSLVEGLLLNDEHRGRWKCLENQLQAAGDPQAVLPPSTKPWQEQGVHTLTSAQMPAEAAAAGTPAGLTPVCYLPGW